MEDVLDELLRHTEDATAWSFYGLDKKLKSIEDLLEKADAALVAKAPSAEATRLGQRRDEIVEVQGRVRKAMVQRIEPPQLIKREQPLAQDFLEHEIRKAKDRGGDKEKMEKVIARLKAMQDLIRSTPPVPDSRQLKDAEAAIKNFQAEYEKLAPIQAKWEAGRHSFKTNAELQDHKKRFENCRKGKENAKPMLEEVLCRSFDVKDAKALAREEAKAEQMRRDGWAAVAKKAAGPPPGAKPASAKRPPPPKRPTGPAAWDAADVTLAQRIRAEAAAQVRSSASEQASKGQGEEEVEEEEERHEEEDYEEEEVVVAKAPPVVRPKPPPPLPALAASSGSSSSMRSRQPAKAPVEEEEDDDDDDDEVAAPLPPKAIGGSVPPSSVSAKRKGKAAKRKPDATSACGAEVDTSDASAKGHSVVGAVLAAVEAAARGSLLQSLLRPSSWIPHADDAAADVRLTELNDALPWANPLGLSLPLSWRELADLEVDFGPKPTSLRNESPIMQRLCQNVPFLLVNHVTILFFLLVLEAIMNFGFLMWAVLLQFALMLVPADVLPQVSRRLRVMALQVAHLLLWFLFVRSLLVMHFWFKLLSVLMICGHAYILAPPSAVASKSS